MSECGAGKGQSPLTQERIGGPFQTTAFDVLGPLATI